MLFPINTARKANFSDGLLMLPSIRFASCPRVRSRLRDRIIVHKIVRGCLDDMIMKIIRIALVAVPIIGSIMNQKVFNVLRVPLSAIVTACRQVLFHDICQSYSSSFTSGMPATDVSNDTSPANAVADTTSFQSTATNVPLLAAPSYIHCM